VLLASQIAPRERGFIRQGMPEGEVLFAFRKPTTRPLQNAKGSRKKT
jgi:hypothetical protein